MLSNQSQKLPTNLSKKNATIGSASIKTGTAGTATTKGTSKRKVTFVRSSNDVSSKSSVPRSTFASIFGFLVLGSLLLGANYFYGLVPLVGAAIGGTALMAFVIYFSFERKASESTLHRSKIASQVASQDLFSRYVSSFAAIPATTEPSMPSTMSSRTNAMMSSVKFDGTTEPSRRIVDKKTLTFGFQVLCVLVTGLSMVKIKQLVGQDLSSASKYFGLALVGTWFGLSLVFYLISKFKKYLDQSDEDLVMAFSRPDVLVEQSAELPAEQPAESESKKSGSNKSKDESKESKQSEQREESKQSEKSKESKEGEESAHLTETLREMLDEEPVVEEDGGEDGEEEPSESKRPASVADVLSRSTNLTSILDISELIVDDDEGENIKTKSEIVTQITPGKWVKEKDRDWKVVERKKKSLDFTMAFAAVPEPSISSIPEEESLPPPPEEEEEEEEEEIEEEEIDTSKIRGSPEIPCLEGMNMEFDDDGDLKKNSEYLKLRREKWVEEYRSRSRMLCEQTEEECNVQCRSESFIGRLECWAVNHPRTLIYIVFVALLIAAISILCCGDYEFKDYMVCKYFLEVCNQVTSKVAPMVSSMLGLDS